MKANSWERVGFGDCFDSTFQTNAVQEVTRSIAEGKNDFFRGAALRAVIPNAATVAANAAVVAVLGASGRSGGDDGDGDTSRDGVGALVGLAVDLTPLVAQGLHPKKRGTFGVVRKFLPRLGTFEVASYPPHCCEDREG